MTKSEIIAFIDKKHEEWAPLLDDDLENPRTGGTGHTMNVCEQNNIPIIDQTTWFKWLEE